MDYAREDTERGREPSATVLRAARQAMLHNFYNRDLLPLPFFPPTSLVVNTSARIMSPASHGHSSRALRNRKQDKSN